MKWLFLLGLLAVSSVWASPNAAKENEGEKVALNERSKRDVADGEGNAERIRHIRKKRDAGESGESSELDLDVDINVGGSRGKSDIDIKVNVGSVPVIKPKPTTVPINSLANLISPEDTIATEATTIGVTASTTEATTIGVTTSTTEATTIGVIASTTETTTIGVSAFTMKATTISVTASTTEATTVGVTASTTEATTVSVTASTTEASTISETASTAEATTIGVTAFTTEAKTISKTASTKETATISETAFTTEARSVGETASITEATTNSETAHRTEATSDGETVSTSEGTAIGKTIPTTEEPTITKSTSITKATTKGETSYTMGATTNSGKASTPEATTIGETMSTAEAPTIAKTTSISESTTISEETSAAEATTRVTTNTTTNAEVSSSSPTKITSVESGKNESIFLNQTSLLPTISKPPETRKFCATCGNSAATVESRIVGGQEAQIGEYPWMVFVNIHSMYGSAMCGGSLIKKKWVVSAAHCFYDMGYESVDLYLGDHNIGADTEVPTTKLLAHRITIHPQYDSTTYANDISLIEISDEVPFNSRILPVCLPNVGDVVPGSSAIVTGWGTTEYGGSVSVRLQEVGVMLVTNADCKKKYSGIMSILPNMLCAYETGKDACLGDSGGPLVVQLADGRWVLAGIVSFGYRCAYPNTPGVYTDVVKYVSWIEQITGSADC